MSHRIHNFNAGPAALPLPVLEEIQAELINFHGSGMSILEVSHRSKWFEDVLDDAIARIKRLLKLDDRYQVLFLQGGASLQFAMVPMNLAIGGQPLDYVDTGTWSTKAIKEAQVQGKEVRVVASSADREFTYIPRAIPVDGQAAYLHVTSNNTIRGTQWRSFPAAGQVPLVADMSSDIFSRVFDPTPFGLIYAGAQKNAWACRGYSGYRARGSAGTGTALPAVDVEVHNLCRQEIHVQHPTLFCHLRGAAGGQVAGRNGGRTGQDGSNQ